MRRRLLGSHGVALFIGLAAAGVACSAQPEEEVDEEAVTGADLCADAVGRLPAGALHVEGRVDPDHERVVAEAARTCLREYIRVNTSNPATANLPGEIAAVQFWKRVFGRLQIPTRTAPLAGVQDGKRASIIATLEGRQVQGSIVLLNHTDVVHADGNWKHPPFSGHDDGTFIWGRGTLDMKHIAVAQMMSMAILKKAGVQPLHDIHFVGVADEEVGGRGAEFIALKKMVDENQNEQVDPLGLMPGVVLNEGGTGIRDSLISGRDVFVLGVEEKGALWTQFAHADLPTLVRAYAKLGVAKAPPREALPSGSMRSALGNACKVVSAVTDEQQSVNVVPRKADLTLDCQSGHGANVEAAARGVATAFSPAPQLAVVRSAGGQGELVRVKFDVGAGGHGSAGGAVTGLDVATALLAATGQVDANELAQDDKVTGQLFKYGLSPANQEFVTTLARAWGKLPAAVAEDLSKSPGIVGFALRAFHDALPTDAPFRNTCNWTTLKYPVDGEARGKLDCRTTFDTKSADLEEALTTALASFSVELRSGRDKCADCYRQEFNQSAFDVGAKSFQIVKRAIERSSPDVIATPYLFPASSDSYFFRRINVPTYGIALAALGEPELRTFHGLDERFPVAQLFPAVRVTTETVLRLANEAEYTLTPAQQLGASELRCEKMDDKGGAWTPTNQVVCDSALSSGSAYRCTRSRGAPRFLRLVPRENDGRIYEIVRLKEGAQFDGPPTPEVAEKLLYQSRESGDTPSTRVFQDQEFEVDTGSGDEGKFFFRCSTPTLQTVAYLAKTKIDFYRD